MSKLKTLLLVSALVLLMSGCGDSDEPEPYYDVGIAFNELHTDPKLACDYVASRKIVFDSRFESCGVTHVTRLQTEIDKLQRECDEIFVDPYDKLKCDEDRGVPGLQRRKFYLASVLEITTPTAGCATLGCSCTNFANYFQAQVDFFDANQPLNMTWRQTMDQNAEAFKKEFAC